MTSQVLDKTDFLPGYRPLEKLGSGGYGEVWKVEAPGGLVKAIKVLHGFSHEQRASDELKALERVKQVRHPFMLSLERIETVEQRLYIVTELADQSLKDYYNNCIRRGKNGIPRPELLRFMRDAADALDFMSEVHGLQHLDIKPENLLLVADHVKVADFGLVKGIENQCVSLVGGLTPVYSAPEVFHGRPSRYSDQYSLAVVYQHMLTAMVPFAGTSAAELTLQHINEAPDLSSLPAGDREVIGRALSKNPDHRYASCRTMVDALIQATGNEGGSHQSRLQSKVQDLDVNSTQPTHYDRDIDRGDQTTPFENDASSVEPGANALLFESLADVIVTEEAPPQVDPESFRAAPTLLVGIGGNAGLVLRQFKRRLVERFGEAAELPAVCTILIDTDASDLLNATHDAGAARLATQETLAVPLRRPQEYRERHGQPFRWLSRRWLYNIPRSLKTEGLRPLGRLAFVDHATAIRARLEKAITQVLDQASIHQTQVATDLPWESGQLNVYLVASICGGTGSGMAMDVAYLLRSLLEQQEVSSRGITGIMLMRTPERPRTRELAAVNAFAWLTEFNHFNRPGAAFPGDTTCGLDPREIDDTTFSNTYLVSLLDHERPEDQDQASARVAEYIYLDALTPVQSFLAGCRSQQSAAPPHDGRVWASIGSFGVALRDATRDTEVDLVCAELTQKVVSSWVGRQQGVSNRDAADLNDSTPLESNLNNFDHLEHDCRQEAVKLQLGSELLLKIVAKLLEVELRASPDAFFQRLVQELRGSRETIEPRAVRQAVDRMFGGPLTKLEESPSEAVILRKPISTIIRPLAGKMDAHLSDWLVGRLDNPELRLTGALEATAWFVAHLRDLSKELACRENRLIEESDQPPVEPRKSRGDQPPPKVDENLAYFLRRFEHATVAAAMLISRTLYAATTRVRNQLIGATKTVRELAEGIEEARASQSSSSRSDGSADDIRRKLAEAIIARETELVSTVNRLVQDSYINRHGGLYRTLCGDETTQTRLLESVNDAARRCMRGIASHTNLLDRLLGKDSDQTQSRLEELFDEARPKNLKFGGQVRRAVAAPQDVDLQIVRQRCTEGGGGDLALLRHPENQLVACMEVSDVSLPHLAMALIRNRRDYANFAQRVLSRKDVPWSSLTDVVAASVSEPESHTLVL